MQTDHAGSSHWVALLLCCTICTTCLLVMCLRVCHVMPPASYPIRSSIISVSDSCITSLTLSAFLQAPAGSPPDVAQQLPMQLLQAASRWYEGQLDARHKAELFLGAVKYLINNEGGKATLQDWVQHSLIGMAVAPHAVALLLSLAQKPSSTDWSANRPV